MSQQQFLPASRVESPIHVAFENHARKCPSATAIRFHDYSISYGELDQETDQLACYLREHFQVRAESIVAFCLEKSTFATIAFLAISKAGGCALALDPEASREHLQDVVSQSKAIAIISSLTTEHSFQEDKELRQIPRLIFNEKTLLNLPRASKESLPKVCHRSAAYIVFTSGTTSGAPKGSIIEHGSASTAVAAHSHLLTDLAAGNCRVLQFSNYTFDVSILETFVALSNGFCLCILDEDQRVNDLANSMQRMEINMAFLTPTVIGLLEPSQIPSLRLLISTGEPLSRKILQLWAPKLRLVNLYGMSEAPLLCVSLPYMETDSNPANIGTEVAGRIHLASIDNVECLVPDGQVGELIAQSHTVGRGYLAAPQKTKLRFIEPPSWASNLTDGERLYRTGDLGYRTPDGNIILVGRADSEEKLHGKRIDLGKIEEKLQSCPMVDQIVVGKLKRDGFSESLMAFVVPSCKEQRKRGCYSFDRPSKLPDPLIASPSMTSMFEDWKKTVPRGMLPGFLLPVTEFPRTCTGKVNRRAVTDFIKSTSLEVLKTSRVTNLKSKEEPSEMSQEVLAMRDLWAKVLSLESDSLSGNDNFFDSGGNSLLAIQLVKEAGKNGCSLNVGAIFQHPVLSDMAARSYNSDTSVSRWKPPPLDTTKYRDRLRDKKPNLDWERVYRTDGCQQILLLKGDTRCDPVHWHHITKIIGKLDVSRLRSACKVLVESTPILRTIFFEDELYVALQCVAKPSDVEHHFFTFDNQAEAEAFWSPRESYLNRFLTEFALVQINNEESLFSVGLHHATVDAWAIPLVFERLATIYQGDSPRSGPDFIDLLHWRDAKPREVEHKEWRKCLRGSIPTSVSDVSPNAQHLDPAGVSLTEWFSDLPLSATHFGAALNAATAITLSRFAKTNDVVFFGVSVGRLIDFENVGDLCGPTVMMTAIRLQIDPSWTYNGVVKAYQEGRIAIQPYDYTNIFEIAEDVTDWRDPGSMPVMVNYMGEFEDVLPDTLGTDGPLWKYEGAREDVGVFRDHDIYFSSMIQKGRAMVRTTHDPELLSAAKMKAIHSCLCDTIRKIYHTPDEVIELGESI